MRALLIFLCSAATALATNTLVISGNATISGNAQMLAGSLAAPNKAVNVYPLDTVTHVDPNVTFIWAPGGGATGFDLYNDKQSVHNPPTTKILSNQNQYSYGAVALSYNTIYNYKVDAIDNIGTTAGDKITFTTAVPTTVTTLERFENGSDTDLITAAKLTSGNFGAGTWTIDPDPAVELTISTEQEFSADALNISGGSGLGDVGSTRSLKCLNNANLQRAVITLGQHPTASIGFALFLGTGFGLTNFNMDFIQMNSGTVIDALQNPLGSTSDFSNFNWQDNSRLAKAHTNAGKSTGLTIPINNRWYWVTMLWDGPNLLTTIKVYDTTTHPWTLLGTQTKALESWNLHSIYIGHVDNTSAFINAPSYIDDFTIDNTGAAFPLIPDEANEVR